MQGKYSPVKMNTALTMTDVLSCSCHALTMKLMWFLAPEDSRDYIYMLNTRAICTKHSHPPQDPAFFHFPFHIWPLPDVFHILLSLINRLPIFVSKFWQTKYLLTTLTCVHVCECMCVFLFSRIWGARLCMCCACVCVCPTSSILSLLFSFFLFTNLFSSFLNSSCLSFF